MIAPCLLLLFIVGSINAQAHTSCYFNGTLCGWRNDGRANESWVLRTSTDNDGIYTEVASGDTARLISPVYNNVSVADSCFFLSYAMIEHQLPLYGKVNTYNTFPSYGVPTLRVYQIAKIFNITKILTSSEEKMKRFVIFEITAGDNGQLPIYLKSVSKFHQFMDDFRIVIEARGAHEASGYARLFIRDVRILYGRDCVKAMSTVSVPPADYVKKYYVHGITTDLPRSTTDLPRSTTDLPRSTTDLPRSPTDMPRLTTALPQSTTDMLRSTTDIPRSTTEWPRRTTDQPRTTTDLPWSTTAPPTTTTDLPWSTTDVPTTTTYPPRTTTDLPWSTTDAPTTTTYPPRTTTDLPWSITDRSRSTSHFPRSTTARRPICPNFRLSTTDRPQPITYMQPTTTELPPNVTTPSKTAPLAETTVLPGATAQLPTIAIDFPLTKMHLPSLNGTHPKIVEWIIRAYY